MSGVEGMGGRGVVSIGLRTFYLRVLIACFRFPVVVLSLG